MTRQEAEELIDARTLTWGAVKTMLRCEMGAPSRKSVVNRAMTHEQVVDILAASVDARDDSEIVCGPKCARPQMDRLLARNCLRECASIVKRRQRYCEMCDIWMSTQQSECRFCGAPTVLEAPEAVDAVAGKGEVL
jgi:hypothetical protein